MTREELDAMVGKFIDFTYPEGLTRRLQIIGFDSNYEMFYSRVCGYNLPNEWNPVRQL